MTNGEEAVVPLFKSYADLIRDHQQIQEKFEAEWEQSYVAHDAALADIEILKDTLSKKLAEAKREIAARVPDPEPDVLSIFKAHYSGTAGEIQRAVIDGIKEMAASMADLDNIKVDQQEIAANQEIRRAKLSADQQLAQSLRDAIAKRDDAFFGVGETARRSSRFAQVRSRRYSGPAATVTSMVK